MGRARTGSAEEDVVAQKGVSLPAISTTNVPRLIAPWSGGGGRSPQTIALRSSRRSPSSGEAMLRSAVATLGWSMARRPIVAEVQITVDVLVRLEGRMESQ